MEACESTFKIKVTCNVSKPERRALGVKLELTYPSGADTTNYIVLHMVQDFARKFKEAVLSRAALVINVTVSTYADYQAAGTPSPTASIAPIIITVAVIGAIILAVVIVVVLWYRRRNANCSDGCSDPGNQL